jgi:hypothetical protein
MQIGLENVPARQAVGLHWLLALPVVARSSEDDERGGDDCGRGSGPQ